MADDELQSHISKGLYGTPQTNPDERRQYLGSLRERVALRITNQEITASTTLPALKAAINQYLNKGYQVLINGKLSSDITAPFITLVNSNNMPFTLISDDTANLDPAGSGLLIVAKDAINQDDISLPESAPAPKDDKPHSHDIFHLFD
ncbi:YueI family protein [Lacticaseibacillus saniviri]